MTFKQRQSKYETTLIYFLKKSLYVIYLLMLYTTLFLFYLVFCSFNHIMIIFCLIISREVGVGQGAAAVVQEGGCLGLDRLRQR